MGSRYVPLFALIACVFILQACKTVNSVERADPLAMPQIVEDNRISTDFSLSRKASVVQIREAVVGNGLAKIQVELLNKRESRQAVNYRFDWVDEQGMVIDSPMSRWTQISLAGKESTWITSVAPTPRAVDFRLKLIEPTD